MIISFEITVFEAGEMLRVLKKGLLGQEALFKI